MPTSNGYGTAHKHMPDVQENGDTVDGACCVKRMRRIHSDIAKARCCLMSPSNARRTLLVRITDTASSYNLFAREENDYSDDDDGEQSNKFENDLRQQKYTTWLYVLFLFTSMYVLFYTAFVQPQLRTITVTGITIELFNELHRKHGETLSCPCSATAMPYRTFVEATVTSHAVCDSPFVSAQWIEALYLADVSRYGTADFRSTASAQFRLLSSLCLACQEIVDHHLFGFKNEELISKYLWPEVEVQYRVNASVASLRNSAAVQLMSFVNYLRQTIRANFLVSALNTNMLVTIYNSGRGYQLMNTDIAFNDGPADEPTVLKLLSCSNANPTSEIGFSYLALMESYANRLIWRRSQLHNALVVHGFVAGCTPFEALLRSTLECLSRVDCVQLLITRFPKLSESNVNWTASLLPIDHGNLSVNDHLANLFVTQWSTGVRYDAYVQRCAPLSCTYQSTEMSNFSDALTLLIGLYGGLVIVLRLVAPCLIRFFFRVARPPRNDNNIPLLTRLRRCLSWLKRFNLFKVASQRTEHNIRQQRISTRIYILLLIGSVSIALTLVVRNTQTITMIEHRPSFAIYSHLQASRSPALTCPCSNIAIAHRQFISLAPTFHSVCNSELIGSRWIALLEQSRPSVNSPDWRNRAASQFTLLAELCTLAERTIDDAVQRFLSQSFVTANVLNETDMRVQFNATLAHFFQSTIEHFDLLTRIIRTVIQADQPLFGPLINPLKRVHEVNPVGNFFYDTADSKWKLQTTFQLAGPRDPESDSFTCICATNPHCITPAGIFISSQMWVSKPIFIRRYTVPGAFVGCSSTESLLSSTLECFFHGSDCFPILMNYTRQMYIFNVPDPVWFDVRQLHYDSSTSRFPPHMRIGEIVEKMLIERWNVSLDYARFYETCAPSVCMYEKSMRTRPIEVITTLVSIIGGMTLLLRMLVPLLIKFAFYLRSRFGANSAQQQTGRRWSVGQLTTILAKVYTRVQTELTGFNMFLVRDFSSKWDQPTIKRFGRWATRLYLFLLACILTVFATHHISELQVLTKSFDEPSLELYKQLVRHHTDELKCPCSSIASSYEHVVEIEVEQHEICAIPFDPDEGRAADPSSYSSNDYRRFLSAHLQFLTSLCQLSEHTINTTIQQLHSSLFVTTELLSENQFAAQMKSMLDQMRVTAPQRVTQLVRLIGQIQHSNGAISTYGSNYRYLHPWSSLDETFLTTEPLTYDHNCSCALHANCTTQATGFDPVTSRFVPLQGLKMGCTPSDSLRASTLECFFNRSCLDLFRRYTTFSAPLSSDHTRFPVNSTVDDLFGELFIEQWRSTPNYTSYYEQCAPLTCSYTYAQRHDVRYVITVLFGLHGGLSILLEWICPKLIELCYKISVRRTKRNNTVQPVSVSDHSIIVQPPLSSVPSRTHGTCTRRRLLNLLSIITLLLCLVVALVLFSIHIDRREARVFEPTTGSTAATISCTTSPNSVTMDTSTDVMLSTTTTREIRCSFQAQSASTPATVIRSIFQFAMLGDFNGDSRLDVVFTAADITSPPVSLVVMLGNGDGTFKETIQSFTSNSKIADLLTMHAADFNGDNRLDLIATESTYCCVLIMYNNGDATFTHMSEVRLDPYTHPSSLATADFNNDGLVDFATIIPMNGKIDVFMNRGVGNETFAPPRSFSLELGSYPLRATAGDFNRDGHQDLVVVNNHGKTIAVLLGDGHGSFEPAKYSFTGGGYSPFVVAVGDFNSDMLPDFVVSVGGEHVVVMFGLGNGLVGSQLRLKIGPINPDQSILIGDFNSDGHADIGFGTINETVMALMGNGHGYFDLRPMFEVRFMHLTDVWFGTGDFNGDDRKDIVYFEKFVDKVHRVLLQVCE